MLVECGTRDLTMPRRRCHFPSSDDNHRVVSFPSAKVRKTAWSRDPTHHRDPELFLILAKFQRDDRQGNYRHRMMMNALAFIVLAILIVIGVWLMTRINDQRRTRLHTYVYQTSPDHSSSIDFRSDCSAKCPMLAVRDAIPETAPPAKAEFHTLRERLINIGAR
jgi:hypothetical protein